MRKIYVLFHLLALGSLFACQNEPAATLPEATQVGRNTLGCLVNGEVWLPKGSIDRSAIRAGYGDGTFFIETDRISEPLPSKNLRSYFSFVIEEDVYEEKTYFFEKKNYLDRKVVYVDYLQNCFYVDSTHIGKVTITKLDTINHIIAGRFEFTLPGKDGCETIFITDGRFDITYRPPPL